MSKLPAHLATAGFVPGAAVQRLHPEDEEGLPVEAAKTTTPVTLYGAALPSG
jgi:hypothetical protein